MMIGKKKDEAAVVPEYREESVKPAIAATVVAVLLVAGPLGWLNVKIDREGAQAADVSRYTDLVATVDRDAGAVGQLLRSDAVDSRLLRSAKAMPVVTLITPDIPPTNIQEAVEQKNEKLDVEISGIYWSPTDPLISVKGENYRVGESIKGFKIVEIRKTEVVFESPAGERTTKYFYDYLGKPKQK